MQELPATFDFVCAASVDIPSIGMNVEHLDEVCVAGSKLSYYSWDLGGSDRIRPLYRYFYAGGYAKGHNDYVEGANPGTKAVIWVMDSTIKDLNRIQQGREELDRVMEDRDEMGDPVVLILANKQDSVGSALSPEEVAQLLGLIDDGSVEQADPWHTEVPWFVQGTCMEGSAPGLQEALQWLYNEMHASPTATRHYYPPLAKQRWSPELHCRFPRGFRQTAFMMVLLGEAKSASCLLFQCGHPLFVQVIEQCVQLLVADLSNCSCSSATALGWKLDAPGVGNKHTTTSKPSGCTVS